MEATLADEAEGTEARDGTSPEVAEQIARAGGGVGVHALAAGFAAALPVPLLDSLLSRAARGSAMRRVAQRHGVRLSHGARDVLSAPGRGDAAGLGSRARLVRRAVTAVVRPLRVASRFDDGLAAFGAAALLDHYLATSARRPGARMTEEEARRVRAAIDVALVSGALGSVARLPAATVRAISSAARTAWGVDDEDRPPLERGVDALLDAISRAAPSVLSELRARFDEALAGAPPQEGPA